MLAGPPPSDACGGSPARQAACMKVHGSPKLPPLGCPFLCAGTLARAYANWYATKDKSKQASGAFFFSLFCCLIKRLASKLSVWGFSCSPAGVPLPKLTAWLLWVCLLLDLATYLARRQRVAPFSSASNIRSQNASMPGPVYHARLPAGQLTQRRWCWSWAPSRLSLSGPVHFRGVGLC